MLIDVFGADPEFGERSRSAVRRCRAEGSLVACDVVWAEVAGIFATPAEARDALSRLGVEFLPLNVEASLAAGGAWHAYRLGGGARRRVIADFLIGAHALVRGERLLTRDRGFYRSYFESLALVDPTES